MTDLQRLVYADLRLALIIGMSRARLEAEWMGDEAQLARVMVLRRCEVGHRWIY